MKLTAHPADRQERRPRPPLLSRSQSVLLWRLPAGRGLAVVASCVVIALALVAFFLARSSQPRVSNSRPVSVPTGLYARQLSAATVSLSWRPVSSATGYLINVGSRRYVSRIPRVTISGTLQPGKRYAWWVRSRMHNHEGPQSRPATLQLRPMPARLWHFPPFHASLGAVLVTLYNPNPREVEASVLELAGTQGSERKWVRIPPRRSTDIALQASSGRDATATMIVVASDPILAERLTIASNVVRPAYGTPQDVSVR